jgi:hypothetical protein
MKHAIAIFSALLGLAASAPAQFRLEGSLGRRVQVGVEVAAQHRGGHHHHGRHDDYRHGRRHDRHAHRGHWQTECYRVWVPGYWQETGGFGHRYWVPGHYQYRTRTIWVRC